MPEFSAIGSDVPSRTMSKIAAECTGSVEIVFHAGPHFSACVLCKLLNFFVAARGKLRLFNARFEVTQPLYRISALVRPSKVKLSCFV